MSNGEVSNDPDDMIPLLVWKSCGFTIISIVISAMEADKPVLGALSSRHNDCLSALIRFCGIVGSNFGDPKVIRYKKVLIIHCKFPTRTHKSNQLFCIGNLKVALKFDFYKNIQTNKKFRFGMANSFNT